MHAKQSYEKQNVLVFGEVLFDYFEDNSSVLGGAPFNVAWHLQQFGLNPTMITRIGEDALGDLVQAAWGESAMEKTGLQLDHLHPTGRVQVTVNQGEPSYQILPDQAYDFIELPDLHRGESYSLLYHGSLALRNSRSRETLEKIAKNTQLPIFLDINLRTPWWQASQIANMLKRAAWVKLNREELFFIANAGFENAVNRPADSVGSDLSNKDAMDQQIEFFMACYPCQLLIVTLGKEGAIAVNSQGQRWQIAPQSNLEVVDTVGAGDAFASVMIIGQLMNWPVELALHRAQSFASAIVNIRGALIKEKSVYQCYLKQWDLQ